MLTHRLWQRAQDPRMPTQTLWGTHGEPEAARSKAPTGVPWSGAGGRLRNERPPPPRARGPRPQPSPVWAPHRTPAPRPGDPGPWWLASPATQSELGHRGPRGPAWPRLPPRRAGGREAPEAGSPRSAQGLHQPPALPAPGHAEAGRPGPAPARACETRPAAPQARMLPTAAAQHRAPRRPNPPPPARPARRRRLFAQLRGPRPAHMVLLGGPVGDLQYE